MVSKSQLILNSNHLKIGYWTLDIEPSPPPTSECYCPHKAQAYGAAYG